MPVARLKSSALRHYFQYVSGDKTEDHLAAVCFNIMALMHFEEVGNPAEPVATPPLRQFVNRMWGADREYLRVMWNGTRLAWERSDGTIEADTTDLTLDELTRAGSDWVEILS